MSRSDYRTLEKSRPDEVLTIKSSSASSRVNRLMQLALLLGLVVVGLRAVSSRSVMDDLVVNPTLLKSAMRAAAGAPVAPAAATEIVASRTPVTGFQARAMSELARSTGQMTTAEAWLNQGLSDPSSGYLAQFELCLLYWNQGRQARAREACRGTRASAVYWLNRGYVADEGGERAEALVDFQMAASINPDLVAAWQQLGQALFEAGRYDEAILAHERVMALDSTPDAGVFHSLSLAYLATDNPTMARDVLNRGLMIYPNERVFYLAMAEAYRQEGDLDTVESWYVRALQRWPYDAQVWAKRAETAVAAGRPRQAEEYFQEAVTIQPDDVGYWMGLAGAAVAGDHKRAATEAFRAAMELRPDDAAIWLQSGRYLVETGQTDEARPIFEHVLELEPDNREAISQLAGLAGRQP